MWENLDEGNSHFILFEENNRPLFYDFYGPVLLQALELNIVGPTV
jgi:hypothetical protein